MKTVCNFGALLTLVLLLPVGVYAGIACPDPEGAMGLTGKCIGEEIGMGDFRVETAYEDQDPTIFPGRCVFPGNSARKCFTGTRPFPTQVAVLSDWRCDPQSVFHYFGCTLVNVNFYVRTAWSAFESCDYHCGQ